ncbi:MAG TPA: response regulator [Burkholderiaceae bacterium]|nr:response regulator [Burkholderiaceae bacterium]
MSTAQSAPTVLVVDDDRLVLATTCSGLRHAGMNVLEADNGDDAILLAREHHPDLALLDIRMNGKDGLSVAAYLREHTGTPFMFLSAFADQELVNRASELGALSYLVKPLDISQVVPAVRAALSRPKAEAGTKTTDMPARSDAVHLATGILMERYRLRLADAQERLLRAAERSGKSADDYAASLIDSVESLAE